MKRRWLIAWVLLLLAFGALLCPRTPSSDIVNPRTLLLRAVRGETEKAYQARRRYTWTVDARRLSTVRDTTSAGGSDLWLTPGQSVSLILRNYIPLIEGEDAIAGRSCWIMRLKPKTKYRPWKQLWVDKRRFVVLASRDWSHEDRVKQSMQTLSVRFGGRRPSLNPTLAPAAASPWPTRVPGGFELVSSDSRAARQSAVYADGLFSISVHRFPATTAGEQHQVPKVYNWSQGLILHRRSHGDDMVIVADLPEREIKRVARSLR